MFHRSRESDNLTFQLPNLKINQYEVKRSSSIKFLGVLTDDNLTWADNITIMENKLQKNLGLIYKAKKLLKIKCYGKSVLFLQTQLLKLWNTTWYSTSNTKYRKAESKQSKLYELSQFLPALPRIRTKAQAGNEGAIYFEYLPT